MSADLWKKLACAAALTLCMGLAHRSLASSWKSPGKCVPRTAVSASKPGGEPVLRGRALVTFAGYELNITFTPGGKLVGFDISTAPKA